MAIPMIGDPQKTRMWRPLMGVAVGAVARLTEDIRQMTWDDTVYTEEHYYGLSLRGPTGVDSTLGPGQALFSGQAQFVFPVGPQTVRKTIEYRQSAEMTLGGIVTEERGIAYIDFTIEGNFGLGPKYGYDTTAHVAMPDDKVAPPWAAPLSGPLWTRKMFANILERYGHMKARPDENWQTALVFHDFKNNDHYIVIPQKVELNRTIATRMMYPFSLTLRAIARTTPVPLLPAPITLASLLAGAVNAARVARTALSLVTDAGNTLTNAASKIRYAVALIDSILDEANRAKDALNMFVETGKRAAELSADFAENARIRLSTAFEGAARDPNFPSDALEAAKSLEDVYDMLQAQPDFQVTDTGIERADRFDDNQRSTVEPAGDVTEEGSAANIAANGGGNTSRQVSRAYGWQPYIISEGDTLENIAAREVGDAGAWFQMAIRNGLRAPFITRSGLPGTATIGDTILIPTPQQTKKTSAATDTESATPVDLYGTDLKVFEVATSAPGRPRIDLMLDPHTGADLATIGGVPNLVQACQMRLWTEQGALLLSPAYGLPSAVGHPNVAATVIALREAVKSGLMGDSRIRKIESMIVVQEDDIVDIEATVIPVASQERLSVGISVV